MKAQQQAVPALAGQGKTAADAAIDGHHRLDGGKLVVAGEDLAVVVGGDEALFAGRRVSADGVDPVALGTEAGWFDAEADLAHRSRIVTDELKARPVRRRPCGQADILAVEAPVALGMLGD